MQLQPLCSYPEPTGQGGFAPVRGAASKIWRASPAGCVGQFLPLRIKGQIQASSDAERLKRLEAENSALRVELADLRERLKRFKAMESVLAETGRLPR